MRGTKISMLNLKTCHSALAKSNFSRARVFQQGTKHRVQEPWLNKWAVEVVRLSLILFQRCMVGTISWMFLEPPGWTQNRRPNQISYSVRCKATSSSSMMQPGTEVYPASPKTWYRSLQTTRFPEKASKRIWFRLVLNWTNKMSFPSNRTLFQETLASTKNLIWWT